MRTIMGVLLVACGASAPVPRITAEEARLGGAPRFLESTSRRDARAVRAQLAPRGVALAGVWFDDHDCRRRFSGIVLVRGAELDGLAACLAALPLRASSRSVAYPGAALWTYGPGLEIEAHFLGEGGPVIQSITSVSYEGRLDTLPTVTQDALEAARRDDATAPDGAASGVSAALADGSWFKICVDAAGMVTTATPRETTSPDAEAAFVTLVRGWSFRPFLLGGRPMPVCAVAHVAHPARAAHQRIPGRRWKGRLLLSMEEVDPHRTAGARLVDPDDDTWRTIRTRGLDKVATSMRICVSPAGIVDDVSILQPSGLPRHDAQLARALATWRFRPYVFDGAPIGFCTSLSFVVERGYQRRPPGARMVD